MSASLSESAGGVIGEWLSDDAKAKGVVDRFLADLEKAK